MGGMYEFIPQESAQQTDNPNPPDVCHTGEVEVGKNYELVSTMRSGMYRYRSGDILRIEEISDDGVPAVRMQYRLGMLSNLFGEKISSGHLDALVHCANSTLNLPAVDSVLQVNSERDGYIFWMEPHFKYADRSLSHEEGKKYVFVFFFF